MTLEDGRRLFGKIYATSHERADRWYRFGRTILYGQLEDETPVGPVRRLATYEDYALRLLADYNVRVARTYGVVELTPTQEYIWSTSPASRSAPPPGAGPSTSSTCSWSWPCGPTRSGSTPAPPGSSPRRDRRGVRVRGRPHHPHRAPGQAEGRRPPLLARLRQLAPPRDPISIQRRSPQRLTLTAAAFGVLFLAGLFLDSLRAGLT